MNPFETLPPFRDPWRGRRPVAQSLVASRTWPHLVLRLKLRGSDETMAMPLHPFPLPAALDGRFGQ